MKDPKKLEEIIKSIPVRDTPVNEEPKTREELERQAKTEAEEEAKQEAFERRHRRFDRLAIFADRSVGQRFLFRVRRREQPEKIAIGITQRGQCAQTFAVRFVKLKVILKSLDVLAVLVAMVRRAALAIVVDPIDRHIPRVAGTIGAGAGDGEYLTFEGPVGIGLYASALVGRRRVEMRALQPERDAEKAADGEASRRAEGLRLELQSRARPPRELAAVAWRVSWQRFNENAAQYMQRFSPSLSP
jgi:hypothetical protein